MWNPLLSRDRRKKFNWGINSCKRRLGWTRVSAPYNLVVVTGWELVWVRVSHWGERFHCERFSLKTEDWLFFATDDHSRVVLEKIEGDPKSDYINASYIPVSTTPIPRSTVHFKSTSRCFEFSIVLLKKTYYRVIFNWQ